MASRRRAGRGRRLAEACAAVGLALGSVGVAQASPGATLLDLVELTDISGVAASPDGRSVAFRTEKGSVDRNTYLLAWHVVATVSGETRTVGGGGEPVYADPGLLQTERAIWSPDGRYLFYRARLDGSLGIWRAASDGSGAIRVVGSSSDVEAVEAEPGGGALTYRLGPSREAIREAEEREYDSGILVHEHVDLAQNLFRGGSVNGRSATQRLTGFWFDRKGLLWSAPRRTRRLDLASLVETDLAEPPQPPAGVDARAVSARSAGGDMATASWDEAAGTLVVRRPTGPEVACMAAPCREQRIVALVWRPGRDELLITTQDRHQAQALYLWAPGRGAPRFLVAGGGLLAGSRSGDVPCAVTTEAAFCVAASAAAPPRLERIDLESGSRSVVYDPNAELRRRGGPVVERLEWRSPGGELFTGSLFLPHRSLGRRAPLFISYYRCEGYLRGGVGDEWPLQPLAGAGFAAICINAPPVRGAYDAPSAYDRALKGIEAVVARLERRGLIDPKRVGMGGLSFGSEVTMWTAVHSRLLAAASIASTQPEPTYYWFNSVRGRDHPARIRKAWGLGAPDETPELWSRLSPALNADQLKAPLLMQLPEQEARYVVELYSRLTNSATPAELYVFPDEAHLKLQPRHKLAVYRRNLDWFRFWLQDHVDPNPEKSDQYRRWWALAERFRSARSSAP